jgi:proteasome lid subunit RPN8/RPN11
VAGEIQIAKIVAEYMMDHARSNPAEECCGLLAGCAGTITRVFPAKNVAGHPATAYEIAPGELFRLMREIRGAGLEFSGIYHSHPAGKNVPSSLDIERAYYPDAGYIILSPLTDAPKAIRAFSIRERHALELEIHIV